MKTVGIDVSKSTLDSCYLTNRITLEATGGYEKPLYLALKTAQLPVVKVNPRQVRDFAKAFGILAKTDKLDAQASLEAGVWVEVFKTLRQHRKTTLETTVGKGFKLSRPKV